LILQGIRYFPPKNQAQKQRIHMNYRRKAGGKLAANSRLSKKISSILYFFIFDVKMGGGQDFDKGGLNVYLC